MSNPTNNYQQEPNSDWESRMARLVGLEEEPQPSQQHSANLAQPPSEPPEPQQVQTEQSLSSNPFAKLGLVGAGTLALVVFAGAFLTSIFNGTGNKRNTVVVAPKPLQPKQQVRPEQLQGETIDTLRTKLALTEQAQAVKAAQQQLRNEKPALPTRIADKPTRRLEAPRYNRPTIVQQIPTPPRTVYVTRTVPIDRPVKVPQQPIVKTVYVKVPQQVRPSSTPKISSKPRVTPQPLPSLAPQNPEPPVPPTPSPTPNPLQEWSKLAKLGSYGQVSNATTAPQSLPNSTAPTQRLAITIPQPPIRIQSPPPTVVAQQQNSKSTVVGTSAKAVLVTAVYGETTRETTRNISNNSRNNNSNNNNNNNNNNNDSSNGEVFVAQLKEPLKAADGSVILPKEAKVYFHNDYTSDKGLMRLNVYKVSWQEKGKPPIEKSVASGNLEIRGSGSQPPVAQQHQNNSGGSRFGNDIKLGLLGGVGRAAEYVNRPNQKAVCTSIGIANSTTNSNPNNNTGGCTTSNGSNGFVSVINEEQRNIGAGLLEGSTKAIVPELSRRIQQQNVPRVERSNLWVMSAGKEVVLFVNGQTQL